MASKNNQYMTLKQLSVDHPYYCSVANYYSNEAGGVWETWSDFFAEFGDSDIDFNMVFRWDIKKREVIDEYYMEVFIMGQRKGLFSPHQIRRITEGDVPQIIEFLKPRFEYLIKLWEPLNN